MALVQSDLYIGLMSGTSLDGTDGVLVQLDGNTPLRVTVLRHCHLPYPRLLRERAFSLNSPGSDELHKCALVANEVSRQYAKAVDLLIQGAGLTPGAIQAIGAHGQTVRHRPGEFDGTGYTVQLLNGALLAELTHIDVVCDFRTADVAAGGQGAPLVPAFHAAVWGNSRFDTAIVNIGGMSNVTLLRQDGHVLGYDTGPGNVLMDAWCERHLGTPYDADGHWAATGRVCPHLLASLLEEPYFQKAGPKSTGRDLFSMPWLERILEGYTTMNPADVQATLAELTATTIAMAVHAHLPSATILAVCGGGAFNAHLLRRLQALLAHCKLQTTASLGMNPQLVESVAFAWLARQYNKRLAGNATTVTGAIRPKILGAKYLAN